MIAAMRSHVLDNLPASSGRVQAGVQLAPQTWFRVGGAAEVLLRPADVQDLSQFLREMPMHMPVTVIGAASNLIIRDGGLPGLVIRLARGFAAIDVEAMASLPAAARWMRPSRRMRHPPG